MAWKLTTVRAAVVLPPLIVIKPRFFSDLVLRAVLPLAILTPPQSFRHLFGGSVRLSFWFMVDGQGPLSGAIA
jgi:hypothetical protein